MMARLSMRCLTLYTSSVAGICLLAPLASLAFLAVRPASAAASFGTWIALAFSVDAGSASSSAVFGFFGVTGSSSAAGGVFFPRYVFCSVDQGLGALLAGRHWCIVRQMPELSVHGVELRHRPVGHAHRQFHWGLWQLLLRYRQLQHRHRLHHQRFNLAAETSAAETSAAETSAATSEKSS